MENLWVGSVNGPSKIAYKERMYAILRSLFPQYILPLYRREAELSSRIHNRALFFGESVVGGLVLSDEKDATYIEFIGHTGHRFKGAGNLLIRDAIDITRRLERPILRLETMPALVPLFEGYGFVNHFPEDKTGMIGMTMDL